MSDEIRVDDEGKVIVVPISYYLAASGDLIVDKNGEWINLHLHDDGSVTWFPHPTERFG